MRSFRGLLCSDLFQSFSSSRSPSPAQIPLSSPVIISISLSSLFSTAFYFYFCFSSIFFGTLKSLESSPGSADHSPEMLSSSNIASRTRSRKFIGGVDSSLKTKNWVKRAPLGKCGSRVKSRVFTGIGVYDSKKKKKKLGRLKSRDFIVISDEDDESDEKEEEWLKVGEEEEAEEDDEEEYEEEEGNDEEGEEEDEGEEEESTESDEVDGNNGRRKSGVNGKGFVKVGARIHATPSKFLCRKRGQNGRFVRSGKREENEEHVITLISDDEEEEEKNGLDSSYSKLSNSSHNESCIGGRTRSKYDRGKVFPTVVSPVESLEVKDRQEGCIADVGESRLDTQSAALSEIASQRRRNLGNGIPVSISGGSAGEAHNESICIARRTRSRTLVKKTNEMGTFTQPVNLEPVNLEQSEEEGEESSDFSSDEENVVKDKNDEVTEQPKQQHKQLSDSLSHEASVHGENNGNGGKNKDDEQEKDEGREEVELGKSTKRRGVCATKDDYLFKLLVNTIWGKEENLMEELNPSPDKVKSQPTDKTTQRNEMRLPLKFLTQEVPIPAEKMESEKLEDELWTEFDFAMKSMEIGFFDSTFVKEEAKADQSKLCQNGKHEFVLEEQIGIRCIFCGFLDLEIQFILPPMATNPYGNRSKSGLSNDAGDSLFGKLFDDGDNDSMGMESLPLGSVWDIIPGTRKTMYPHQREGFEFMWKNLAGGICLEELKKSACADVVGGCVISHAPGTGKTRLTIVFLQSFMAVFPECRPIIVCPQSMLLTWEREFKKWKVDIPFHILNGKDFSGKEDNIVLKLYHKGSYQSKNNMRLAKLYSWNKGRSILGVSYCLFQKLIGKSEDPLDKQAAQIAKIILERPGLLVLDEGHTPRNSRSLIWKALVKVKTERRIILSGTPFQNNFDELYNVLCLVRPKFADNLSSKTFEICQSGSKVFSDMYKSVYHIRKKTRGEWASLTDSISQVTNDNLEELKTVIHPFVHIHKGTILEKLPGLRDCLVVLWPLPYQKQVLESIQNIPQENHMGRECAISLVSVHPSLIMACNLSEKEEHVLDRPLLEKLRHDPSQGVKTEFVMEMIRLSGAMNEKVLVFSQYIEPLEFIKGHLQSHFNWTEGKEVLQLDGRSKMKHRQYLIDSFNDPSSDSMVLLASTRACCEGINLIGASRVVILDVVWNPQVERQAISRAYRLGQEKVVYTYHLLTSGTSDSDKYKRQVMKDRLSELVFSSMDGEGDARNNQLKVPEDKILDAMVSHENLKSMFEKILLQPKESNLEGAFN